VSFGMPDSEAFVATLLSVAIRGASREPPWTPLTAAVLAVKVADMLLDGDLWGGTRLPRTEPSRCPRVHDEGASNERS